MNYAEVPIGFGIALAENEAAFHAYAAMTREKKQAILQKAHTARSQQEMQRIVADIALEG